MSGLFDGVEALTFDCYGTIIDWETGIRRALRDLLARAEAMPDDETLLELFGRFESEAQRGPFRPYRRVLEEVAGAFADVVGVEVSSSERSRFAESVGAWPPFPDSVSALEELRERYRLVIVSNVDDDLFHVTQERLGVAFDEVVTAQQVRSYKPGLAHFSEALRRLRLPKSRVVHVAQSLYHDVAPATSFGLRCCWVDRRQGRSGGGATPPAEAEPDLTVPHLAALARQALP